MTIVTLGIDLGKNLATLRRELRFEPIPAGSAMA